MGFGRALVCMLVTALAGCTSYESAYERSVYAYEPVYCYQSLGAVSCYRQPQQRDARRLVNYYGPGPSKYPQPEPVEKAEGAPLPKIGRYSLDPEPDPAQPGSTTTTAAEDNVDSWKRYLPLLTVLFGAAQLAAAFLF